MKKLASAWNAVARFLKDIFSGALNDPKQRLRALLFIVYAVTVLAIVFYLIFGVIIRDTNTRKLYFYSPKKNALVVEKQKILKKKTKTARIKATIDALRDGPMSVRLERLLPYDMNVKNVLLVKGLLIVDFDERFFIDIPEDRAALTLESLSKTIFKNFGFVKEIQILINNAPIGEFAPGYDLRAPIRRAGVARKETRRLKKLAQEANKETAAMEREIRNSPQYNINETPPVETAEIE